MRGPSRITCDGAECTAFISIENYTRRGLREGWRSAPSESGQAKHLCPKHSPASAEQPKAPEVAP